MKLLIAASETDVAALHLIYVPNAISPETID